MACCPEVVIWARFLKAGAPYLGSIQKSGEDDTKPEFSQWDNMVAIMPCQDCCNPSHCCVGLLYHASGLPREFPGASLPDSDIYQDPVCAVRANKHSDCAVIVQHLDSNSDKS